MVPFLEDIEMLSQMPAGLELAIKSMFWLAPHTYANTSGDEHRSHYPVSTFGKRPSDGPADELLCNLSRVMKGRRPLWKPKEELKALQQQVELLEGHNIRTYFPESVKLLRQFVKD